jgi:hypothetical protein
LELHSQFRHDEGINYAQQKIVKLVCSAASQCVILILVDNPFTFTHSFVVFCWATCFGLYGHHQAHIHDDIVYLYKDYSSII